MSNSTKTPPFRTMFTVFRTKNRHVLGEGSFLYSIMYWGRGTAILSLVVGWHKKKRNRKESYPKHGKSEAYPIAQTYLNPTKIITVK